MNRNKNTATANANVNIFNRPVTIYQLPEDKLVIGRQEAEELLTLTLELNRLQKAKIAQLEKQNLLLQQQLKKQLAEPQEAA
jgi:phage pi2 protein 07